MNNKAPMSDKKRRLICRTSFFIFCLIPTCLVAYLILHPFSASDWEQLIEAKLGLQATIDKTERTGPWTTILRGVTLQGEEAADRITATEIKIVHGSRIDISIEQPLHVTTSMARNLAQIAGRKLLAAPKPISDALVRIRQIKLSNEQQQSRLFHDVQWKLGQREEDQVVCTKLLAKTTTSSTTLSNIEVYFEKSRSDVDQSVFHLGTSNGNLEGWILTSLVPEIPRFIDTAKFSGEIETSRSRGKNAPYVTRVQGFLMDVPLDRLEPSQGLTGNAKISIRNCELVDGKIRRFDIETACQDGLLSEEFIAFLETDVRLSLAGNVSRSNPTRYSALMFRAILENGLLTLKPPGDETGPGHTVVFGPASEALASWGHSAHQIDLCAYLLKPANVARIESTNRAVELLSHFDLPNPLPFAVGERVADQSNLIPTPANPPKQY